MPLEEVSRRLGVEYGAVSNRLMRFRQLIALYDPDGYWTPLVRLGPKYCPHGECPKCGHDGQLNNGGFSADNKRRAKCPSCAYVWPLDAASTGGDIPVIVANDLAVNASGRRRRAGLEAPDLPRVGSASVRTQPRTAPVPAPAPLLSALDADRFDYSSPLRHNSPLPRRHVEDKELTRFLKSHVDRTLSDNVESPPCPHCGSDNTRLASMKRALSSAPIPVPCVRKVVFACDPYAASQDVAQRHPLQVSCPYFRSSGRLLMPQTNSGRRLK